MATTLFKPAGVDSASPAPNHCTTIPSRFRARDDPYDSFDAAIATTLLNPTGALAFSWSVLPIPQQITIPSDLSARLFPAPAAIAITLLSPTGGVACPAPF